VLAPGWPNKLVWPAGGWAGVVFPNRLGVVVAGWADYCPNREGPPLAGLGMPKVVVGWSCKAAGWFGAGCMLLDPIVAFALVSVRLGGCPLGYAPVFPKRLGAPVPAGC